MKQSPDSFLTSYPDFALLEVGQDERTVFTMQPTKYRIDSMFTGLKHTELMELRNVMIKARDDIRNAHPYDSNQAALVMDLAVLNWDISKDIQGITHLIDEHWFTAA